MIVPPASRLDVVEEYYFAHKLREVRALIAAGNDVVNLGIGNPDLPPAEDVVSRLQKEAKRTDVHGYQPYMGIASLRASMAGYYQNTYGVTLDPELEILPLMGSKEGIFHLSMAFLNPGDHVLVPNPGYLGYTAASRLAGATTRLYNLTADKKWLPDFAALEAADLSGVKMMWINYPHMPTGATASREFFQQVSRFGERHSILICHDNPYSRIDNAEPLSIFNGGSKECCIELNSLSKSHNMAGWRIGMLIGATEYLQTALAVKSNLDSGMFQPIQQAASEALALQSNWLNKQSEIYRRRKQLAYHLLDALGCSYVKDTAGMFVWAQVANSVENVETFVDRLLFEKHVFIAPGFIFGSNGMRYVRISVCAPEERIQEAINRLN
ncbi:MAG: pyridoxal phosphate-dependent aminotransferase [Calditrichia bacterium]